jgi:hypothetical protein
MFPFMEKVGPEYLQGISAGSPSVSLSLLLSWFFLSSCLHQPTCIGTVVSESHHRKKVVSSLGQPPWMLPFVVVAILYASLPLIFAFADDALYISNIFFYALSIIITTNIQTLQGVGGWRLD